MTFFFSSPLPPPSSLFRKDIVARNENRSTVAHRIVLYEILVEIFNEADG